MAAVTRGPGAEAMAVIGFASVRSCGVTTLTAGVAMTWPEGRPRLLVEADPAGGTLGALGGLAPEPGLVSLAAAARRHGEPSLAFDHVQMLPGGVSVVCGPPSASRARSALSMLSGLLARLGELDVEVHLDCGRLDQQTGNLELFEGCDLAVLACRPHLSDLSALAAFVDESFEVAAARPVLVLVGDGPYPAKEITDALGLDVAGQLPWDPDAAGAIGTVPVSSRQLTRTPLVRALRSLTGELARQLEDTRAGRDRPTAAPTTASTDAGELVAGVHQ